MGTEDATASPIFPKLACLGRDKKCPLCGCDNQCRVAKGRLYKGPCWCHEIVISGHILRRLAQDHLEQTCLCPTCLETVARLTRILRSREGCSRNSQNS